MNNPSHPMPDMVDELVGEVPLPPDNRRLDPATRRAAIAMTAIFWSANIGVAMYRAYLDAHPNLSGLLLGRVLTALGGAILCYGIHLVIVLMGRKPFWTRALTLVVMMPFVAEAEAWIALFSIEYGAPGTLSGAPWTTSAMIQTISAWVWFFLAWGALYLALRYSAEVMAAERRARVIQGLAHNAQLRALQNQISPHFMFNTLNSISALMLDGAVREAESMLRQLSEFLRATLALDALSDITLEQELGIQRMYLGIEQARFPDMTVDIDCSEYLGNALVPALITQPIVENAVKYGVAASIRPTRIRIAAAEADGRLVLTVDDDGQGHGPKAAGLGVGLRNVRDRLHSRFGDAHGFSAAPRSDGGFHVELSLPLTRNQ
jgi:two-component system LytT family sensor kinase